MAQEEAHCASNIVSNSHLFHSKPIDLPIPKIWLLKIWPWKYKVKVMGEVKVLSHNLGPTSYQIVLEIPQVRQSEVDTFGGGLGTFCWFSFNLMFMIWNSSHEDLQLFDWVSNTASYGFISFYVNPPSYSYDRAFSKFDLQNPRSHNRNNILSTHIPFIPCWSALPFLRCSYLKNWPWKSKVKGEVKVQSHKVSLTSYRLTSLWFHVNRPSHSWDTAF